MQLNYVNKDVLSIPLQEDIVMSSSKIHLAENIHSYFGLPLGI